jgi:hypothetical protein
MSKKTFFTRKEFGSHLDYECRMLLVAAYHVQSLQIVATTGAQFALNVHVESFLVHARLLISIMIKQYQSEDVFFDSNMRTNAKSHKFPALKGNVPQKYKKHKGSASAPISSWNDVWTLASKHVVHFTSGRATDSTHRVWHDVAMDIAKSIVQFFADNDLVDDDLKAPDINRITEYLAVPATAQPADRNADEKAAAAAAAAATPKADEAAANGKANEPAEAATLASSGPVAQRATAEFAAVSSRPLSPGSSGSHSKVQNGGASGATGPLPPLRAKSKHASTLPAAKPGGTLSPPTYSRRKRNF